MSKFVFPKHQVSYWDDTLKQYVNAGRVTHVALGEANYGRDITRNILANTSSGVKVNVPLSILNEEADGDEVLCRVRTYSSIRLFKFYYKSDIEVTVELNPNVPLNREFIVMFKIKLSKPVITDTITLTIGEVPDITIPVRVGNINLLGDGFGHLGMGQAGAATYVTYHTATSRIENLYYAQYDEDSFFVASQVIFNTYQDAYNYARISLGVDLKANKHYFINWSDLASAYQTRTGRTLSNTVRLIFRTITNPIVFGNDDLQPVPAAMSSLYNYSVGIITPVTNFVVSEDGYTISGKFNAWCNVAMVFNSNAPINFTTEQDGSFTYTGEVNLNIGGIMRLTPSNLIGSHSASVLTILDKMAPGPIANATITSAGIYGTAEVGTTVKVYDETDTLLATYLVPSNGLVEILFDTPIPADVESKFFYYSIADASNNILTMQSILYESVLDVETGPMTHVTSDLSMIGLSNSSSNAV